MIDPSPLYALISTRPVIWSSPSSVESGITKCVVDLLLESDIPAVAALVCILAQVVDRQCHNTIIEPCQTALYKAWKEDEVTTSDILRYAIARLQADAETIAPRFRRFLAVCMPSISHCGRTDTCQSMCPAACSVVRHILRLSYHRDRGKWCRLL